MVIIFQIWYIFQIIVQNLKKMNIPNLQNDLLSSLKEPRVDIFPNIFQNQQNSMNKSQSGQASVEEMQNQDEQEWRSNILISSLEDKQKSPFALRHLTSFEEKSMDKHGKRLSQTFKQYICWVKNFNYYPQSFRSDYSLSNLDWEIVEGKIKSQSLLTEEEKTILINAAHRNTQAELVISEIIEQIPEQYYGGALIIAASLIKQFDQNKLKGQQKQQISQYVSESYIIKSGTFYERLCSLGIGNKHMMDHEKYFNFIRNWMEVFFLSLNGFLQNSYELAQNKNTHLFSEFLNRAKSSTKQ